MKIKGINFKCGTLFLLCIAFFLVCAATVHSKNDFKLKLGAKGQTCLKCHEADEIEDEADKANCDPEGE